MRLTSLVLTGGPEPSFEPFTGKRGRRLYRPNETMAILQAGLLSYLRGLLLPMPYAHGAIRHRSPLTNAQAHQRNRYFYQTDLVDAYGNVRPNVLAKALLNLDSQLVNEMSLPELTQWLSRYCFVEGGGLYSGGAASPMLFNIYASVLIDTPMVGVLERLGLTYTRYMDDLTFSSAMVRIGQRTRRSIREVIWAAGFACNDAKTKINIDLTKHPVIMAGVMLTPDGRLIPPPQMRARAEGAMHAASSGKRSMIDIAHGYVGSCSAATRSGKDSTEPFMKSLRRRQHGLPKS